VTRPLKVLTIVGTRPEIIRLAAVVRRLDEHVDHVLVHTGQNRDHALNQVFFDDLGLRPPDHVLDVDTSSLGRTLGTVLVETERVLLEEAPDAVVVLGDTNSCLSSVVAKRMRIPVFHLEAGNRSFDEDVPEETNRRLVDHVADYALAYTEHARRNLLAEGVHPQRIVVVGSPLREVLAAAAGGISSSDVLEREGLEPGGYVLVSLHREENVDDPARLTALLDALRHLGAHLGLPVLVSTHPRTRRRLTELERGGGGGDGCGDGGGAAGLVLHEPFGFHDWNALQLAAAVVVSDSGTISEEAAILGFPAVTLRDRIERPEALDAGTIVTSTADRQALVEAVGYVTTRARDGHAPPAPAEYLVDDTSHRVVSFVIGTARSHHARLGLRPPVR